MLAKSLFINKFQKGSTENPNLGMGVMVGIDTYTKKGVAMLAKKTTNLLDLSGTGGYPHFLAVSALGTRWWVQNSDGQVLFSDNSGSSWTGTSFPDTGSDYGNGMIFFQNYMFAFTPTKIYYTAATGTWVDWTTDKGLGALINMSTSPVVGLHFPFLFPSSRGVYFGNASAGGVVGFFGQNGTTTFNPAGVTGTDFLYNNSILSLPSNTYAIEPINFLPPTNLALAVKMFQEPQSSDLINWDTITNNKFSPPLRLYSNTQGFNKNGIKQLSNRNQVLYSISGGNHTIYETNGSNFNLVDDIALYSNIRGATGAETTLPVFFNSYPQASAILGNKLLTAVSTPDDNSYIPSGKGIFPIGIWSVCFNQDGTKSTQCEYTLPSISIGGTSQNVLVSPGGSGNYAKITCILPVGSGKVLIGYAYKNSTLVSGVAVVETSLFIDDISKTAIESPLWEIGTALNPQAVNNIEINLAKTLLTGQTVDIAYRTSLSNDWTTLETFTGDGTQDFYQVTANPIGATRFLQLRLRMATGSGGSNTTDSPELRSVIIS